MSASLGPWKTTCCDEYPDTGGKVILRAFVKATRNGTTDSNDLIVIVDGRRYNYKRGVSVGVNRKYRA
jgi:hypothetical protein